MRKIAVWCVIFSLPLFFNSCLVDIIEPRDVKIDAKDIEMLTKNVDLRKYPLINDTTDLPVTAWFGIPTNNLTLNRFQELKDAGININYYRYSNADSVQKALDLSQQVGIKTLINCPELMTNTKEIVARFKDHPANAGYFVRDEPPLSMIPPLNNLIKTIKSVDKSRMCYVNLLPLYGTSQAMGTDNYNDYVKRYVDDLQWDVVSFDFYPIEFSGIRYGWYKNLEIIRDESKRIGKDFWAFALTTSHSNYPIPTLDHLRLQVYSNLAYGARGIQYYTYWTTTSPNYVYTSGPIGKDGAKTVVYDHLKQVNSEMNALSHIFLSSEVTKVSHYGKSIPDGTQSLGALPSFIKSIEFTGNSVVVSEMKNNEKSFMMIQNSDLYNPLGLIIETDSLTEIVLKNGKIIPASLISEEIRINSGDMVMFMR